MKEPTLIPTRVNGKPWPSIEKRAYDRAVDGKIHSAFDFLFGGPSVESALMVGACFHGQKELVKKMLESKITDDARSHGIKSAIEGGHMDIAMNLLNQKVASRACVDGCTHNKKEFVKHILSKYKFDSEYHGLLFVHICAEEGHSTLGLYVIDKLELDLPKAFNQAKHSYGEDILLGIAKRALVRSVFIKDSLRMFLEQGRMKLASDMMCKFGDYSDSLYNDTYFYSAASERSKALKLCFKRRMKIFEVRFATEIAKCIVEMIAITQEIKELC